MNFGNEGNQSGVAKLTASAMLKPILKPVWYPLLKVITNSPGYWIVFVKFIFGK